jgi:hypothetical protein
MGVTQAYRENPDAIWFCHHTVEPMFLSNTSLQLIADQKPRVCAGFTKWRENETAKG